MPYLGDYLGHLLSEITIARMQADLEAVRVAELYATHPLLRTFPIPHFRLPDVDLDIPVVIQKLDNQSPNAPPRGAPPLTAMRQAFEQAATRQFRSEGLTLDREKRKSWQTALDEQMAALMLPRSEERRVGKECRL